MAPQTHLAPHLDASTTYGSGYTIPQFVTAPHLQVGFGFGPSTIQGTPTEGLVVKAADGTVLEAFGREFTDPLVPAGTWQFGLENDDADMPDFDDVLAFEVDGLHVFSGLVEGKRIVTHSQSEEVGQFTALTGRDRIAALRRGRIRPSRGPDAVPVELTRTWSWLSTDFDDSAWAAAKRIRRADIPHPYHPYRALPEWWPDKTAYWVAPDLPIFTGSSAPVGDSLYRWTFTLADDADIDIFTGLNNKGTVWLNGARIGDISNQPVSGNRVRIEGATAGTYVVAALVTNFIRDTGFLGSVWTVDDDGLLDTLVSSTDADDVVALRKGATLPGFTPGEIARLALEEIQDTYGELLGVTLDFTDTLDSAGRPWQVVPEVTSDVGRSYFELLVAMSDWLVDVKMAPGGPLRMWEWGTRGSTPGVSILATTDTGTSDVEELTHDGRATRANRLLVLYKRGYTTVDDIGEGEEVVADFLDLSHVDNEATARTIASQLMANRSAPSYARSLTLSPNSPAPFDAFDVGDYVTHDDEAGGTDSFRVLGVTFTDDGDHLVKKLDTNDIRAEVEERHANWLQRRAHGTLAGGARAVGQTGEPIGSVERVIARDVAEFSFQTPVNGLWSGKRPASASGNLVEVVVEVTTDGSPTTSATSVRLWRNSTALVTATVPAGSTLVEVDLDATKTYRNVDKYRAEVVSVGTDVEAIDVQVRAI